MNATITREPHDTYTDEAHAQRSKDLVQTLGRIYWLVCSVIALGVAVSSGWMSQHWFSANVLAPATVAQAIVLMGLTISGQMLLGFYTAGLFGLQHHILCNIIITIVVSDAFCRSGTGSMAGVIHHYCLFFLAGIFCIFWSFVAIVAIKRFFTTQKGRFPWNVVT